MKTPSLGLDRDIGSDSIYGRSFDIGKNIAQTLSREDASSAWDKYISSASTAVDTLGKYPVQSVGALMLHQYSKKIGLGIGGGKIDFNTKHGSFELGKMNGGTGVKFNLDKSILKKLEQKLMR